MEMMASLARLRADAAMQLRCAQAMKEAPIHRCAVQHRDVAAIGVRQHGFRPKLAADLLQPRYNFVESLVPCDALKRAVAVRSLRGNPPHGIENAVGRVHAVKILGNFAAQKSARDGMLRIALDFGRPPIFHGDEHGATVGTIMGTRRVDNSLHSYGTTACLIIPRSIESLRQTKRPGALLSPGPVIA